MKTTPTYMTMESISPTPQPMTLSAVAVLDCTSSKKAKNEKVQGYVLFEERKDEKNRTFVLVSFHLKGFPKAHTRYAIHIHEFGDLRQGCESLGGHFNPYHATHGSPQQNRQKRHVGDLMNNLKTDAKKEFHSIYPDYSLRLSGKNSILGRSVVVHEGVDDLGQGGFPDSLKTGHAGKRMVCGVIGRTL
jgi:Cu-Zn family superoxide dismutase